MKNDFSPSKQFIFHFLPELKCKCYQQLGDALSCILPHLCGLYACRCQSYRLAHNRALLECRLLSDFLQVSCIFLCCMF